jgi:hypothetical protein
MQGKSLVRCCVDSLRTAHRFYIEHMYVDLAGRGRGVGGE